MRRQRTKKARSALKIDIAQTSWYLPVVPNQPFFPEFEKLKQKDFGGSQLRGNAREPRPLSTRRPLHLVLRSGLAMGEKSFLKRRRARAIQDLVRRTAQRTGVRLYRFANSGNHLHFILRAKTRRDYRRFVRAVTGLVARITLGTERGRGQGIRFWDARPFTRILEWGRDYRNALDYLERNSLEALGFIPYTPRRAKPG